MTHDHCVTAIFIQTARCLMKKPRNIKIELACYCGTDSLKSLGSIRNPNLVTVIGKTTKENQSQQELGTPLLIECFLISSYYLAIR